MPSAAGVRRAVRRNMESKASPLLHSRVWRLPDGTLLFLRFTVSQQLQHWVLLLSSVILAVTGLAQKFSEATWSIFLTNLLGGLDVIQVIHHVFSTALIALAVYHLISAAYDRFVNTRSWTLLIGSEDWRNAAQLLRYDLGRAAGRPRFGRYSIEEKATYWFTFITVLVMIVTGLVLWFPMRATEFLPGTVVPLARMIHGWQAIMGVAFVLIVHLYQTVIRVRNASIFTGFLSEKQMQREHPVEYEATMAQLQPPATAAEAETAS